MEYRTITALAGIIILTAFVVLFANAEGNAVHLAQEVSHQIMDHILIFMAGACIGSAITLNVKKATSRR